jgi:TRAP-type transport system small permease protein
VADAKQQSWLARAEAFGRGLESVLLVVLFAALLLLAASQIVLRNFFSAGLPWADSLVRVLVLWLALIGAIAASRDNKHIAIDVIVRSLPAMPGRIVASAICLFTAGVAAFFAWHSLRFVQDSREFGDVLVNGWPAWILQLILPIGFALIAYRYLVRSLLNLLGRS